MLGDMQGAVAWRKVQANAIGDYTLTALPYINGARISRGRCAYTADTYNAVQSTRAMHLPRDIRAYTNRATISLQ